MILLNRFAYTPYGTFGQWIIGDFKCFTVEPPWQNNKVKVSCIPEGWYTMQERESRVVYNSTNKRYTIGWEILNVVGRTFIMVHPGNTMDATEGCVCPGDDLGFIHRKWAVTNSQNTFDKLMEVLDTKDEWMLKIYRGELPCLQS